MEKPDIVFPLVHLNGTSAQELFRQQREVSRAASALYVSLAAAAPNGRDYYPLGDQKAYAAYEEHKQRLICAARIKQDADRAMNNILKQAGIRGIQEAEEGVDSPEETS